MLSELKGMMGKHPKTASTGQPPEILYTGKASNGVTVTVVQEDEHMRKVREKVIENAKNITQLDIEIAAAKQQKQEADTRAAKAAANIDASKKREAQLHTDVQQLQQGIADDEDEIAQLMAQLAQIEKAQQNTVVASKI